MDQTMMANILPANMIISNFVKGESDSNYEIYLLELLNASNHFRTKSSSDFYPPISEAHSECDAISSDYQIDFKLLASTKLLQAQSLFSHSITKLADGMVAYGECHKKDGKIQATRIFAAFRGKSISELEEIFISHSDSLAMELYQVLKLLKKKKNLLLFFPYKFSFTVEHNDENAVRSISEGLENDFKNAFIFREKSAPGFDTYLTCIYNDLFLIFQVRTGEVTFCEFVDTKRLPTYEKLKAYNEWP